MLSELIGFLRGDVEFIELFLLLAATCFVVFCATPLHEFAHAFVAVKLGDNTPRNRGRLTVNPLAHIDPIGAAMIFLCGFGYAKPVEVRMRNFKNPKRDMAIVALAGPLCNLLQGFIFMFFSNALIALAVSTSNLLFVNLSRFFYFATIINVNLAVFNLIPIPPLDGSRLLTALLPAKYYYGLMKYERYIMIDLFVLLFTGVLTVPLSKISGYILVVFDSITSLPF